MFWTEQFPLSNGNETTEDEAEPVYRSYATEADVFMDADLFDKEIKIFKVYESSNALKDIVFHPKTTLPQGTSLWHFAKLTVRIPKNP